MDNRQAIGVDIGGTKVAAGLVDSTGRISHECRFPMVATGDAHSGFAAVQQAIETVLASTGNTVAGIGVCSPGPLDPRRGVVLNPPNLPCWRNFPLADEIGRRFDVSARVDNDANAAALAEAIWGAGVGYDNLFYACLGTGIGTGIVLQRQIYYGRTGAAAEGGHVSIDYRGPQCGCGKRGCIETYCSGPAIARRARARIAESGNRGRIVESAGAVENVRAEHVGQAFADSDDLAKAVLVETASLLSVWLGNMIDILEPDVIILGGGVSEMLQPFMPQIAQETAKWSVNSRAGEIPIVGAKYGANSGIAGAGALVIALDVP